MLRGIPNRVVVIGSLLAIFGVALTLVSAPDNPFTPRNKAFFADPNTVDFVRPGLVIRINSAEVSSDGTISTVFSITDPRSLPLDRAGVTTPGAVSLSFVAAFIPRNQDKYTSYTVRRVSGPVVASTEQAAAESNGTFTALANGQYRYTFATKAPSGYDRSATHTIGMYGSRNLTEFDLGTNYASTTFSFAPDGSAVTKVRDVIRTASCNKCHDQLSAHGGSRRGIELCNLCHTPQTTDPDTGNSVDMTVMVHKIHMGEELPSVQAGKPYQIIGFNNSVADYSTVVHPANPRRCESCHEQNSAAVQKTNFLAKPSRAACGSCHDNVNFATGENHASLPQVSDNQCATCHTPQGELEFDVSIKGAHVVPTESANLGGLNFEILRVTDGAAGKKPTVSFSVKDKAGNPVPLDSLGNLSLVLAGPTRDYGYTNFGSDVTTRGYVSENARVGRCGSDGVCTYTFLHAIPDNAIGTYAIGMEGRRTETLLPGTTKQMSVQYGGMNKVTYFSVDGSALQPRRAVVSIAKCNQCHSALSLHGENRNQIEMCVLCHNPSMTDFSRRATAVDTSERTRPFQSVNMPLMIHRIHTGEKLAEAGRDYTVIGFGGSVNRFGEVRYPAMAPNGTTADTRNCAMCHVSGTEQTLSDVVHDVVDPQGPISPVKPVTSACTGCHVNISAASHGLVNTSILGESCETCHGRNADFSVAKEHAQY